MDLIQFGCPIVASPAFQWGMEALDALGDGFVGVGIAVAILAYGVVVRDPRVRRVGLAALLAVVTAGLLSNLLKLGLHMPRPHALSRSFGFPSGHTSTAFALAASLGWSFPGAAPAVYLVASLVGVARLYYRAHFVVDVVGGAVVGTGAGMLWARRVLGRDTGRPARAVPWAGWAPAALAAAPLLAFFVVYERALDGHAPVGAVASASETTSFAVRFGTPEARALLVHGWSEDTTWRGRFPMVWGGGLESRIRLPSLPVADHRFRLRLRPAVAGEGASCWTVEVVVNGQALAHLLLERGWREYDVPVPKEVIQAGDNEMRFRFASSAPALDGKKLGRSSWSAGFARLDALREMPEH